MSVVFWLFDFHDFFGWAVDGPNNKLSDGWTDNESERRKATYSTVAAGRRGEALGVDASNWGSRWCLSFVRRWTPQKSFKRTTY